MKTFLKIFILLFCSISFAQTTISGTVTDNNGQPVPGANGSQSVHERTSCPQLRSSPLWRLWCWVWLWCFVPGAYAAQHWRFARGKGVSVYPPKGYVKGHGKALGQKGKGLGKPTTDHGGKSSTALS